MGGNQHPQDCHADRTQGVKGAVKVEKQSLQLTFLRGLEPGALAEILGISSTIILCRHFAQTPVPK